MPLTPKQRREQALRLYHLVSELPEPNRAQRRAAKSGARRKGKPARG